MTQDDTPAPAPQDAVPERFRVDLAGQTLLGTYRVESRLAEGGMGSIYRAFDTSLGRPVVVKVPHARFLAEAGFRARLAREVSELVRLEHPHVVRILARGEQDDIPFFVLQYLGGGSLEDHLAGGTRQAPEDTLPWLATMGRTLDFVHKRGSLHRDVKPGNILFDEEGHVFLSDFGVAKAVDSEGDALTGTGVGIGSPKYMAPEQALGRDLGPAVDQYGLASTLYEALAGRSPFGKGTPVELLVRKSHEEAQPIRDHVPDLPEAAASALMRAMARDPDDRFPSCSAFADAFAAGLGREPATTKARPTAADTVRFAPHAQAAQRKRLAGSVLATLLVAIALVAFFSRGGDDAPPGEAQPRATPHTDLAQVELIEEGAEPRRLLRYDVAPGARERLVLAVTGGKKIDVDGLGPIERNDPPWELDADVVVEKIDEVGDVHFLWRVGRCALCDGAGDDLAALDREMANVEGFTVRGRASTQGIVHSVAFPEPKDLDFAARTMLEGLQIALNDFCTPLPTEPVGIGARWAVTRTTRQFGMRMVETTEYELVRIEGHRVGLRLKAALTAPEQPIHLPGAPEEMGMTLTSFHGRGLGEIRVDLTQLVPRGLASRVEGTYEAESSIPGNSGSMGGSFFYEVEMARR